MTTTFQTALTSPNYLSLRSDNGNNSWWAKQYITLCKNTVIFAARVNGAISVSSFAQIVFDTVTTGAYTDVEIGETFFLSHTSDIRQAYYRGRNRALATSTLLSVNETSVNITDNDYIFVVYDFDIWDVLSRMVNGIQYQDFDLGYLKMPPVAVGLQTAYVNYDPTDGAYRIAFNVSSSYQTDFYSTSTLSFQFTFKAGTYSVVSGALNTAVVTVDFNANTEQWGKLLITDSQGTEWVRRFYIRAHGSTDTPALDFSGAQITGSLDNGWNATVNAWNGVDGTLNQTFTVIWSQEYYNGVLGPIYNNIDMVGRFHREENHGKGDPTYGYISDVKFDIEGIATQMQRLQEQDLTTIVKSVAAAWDEISFNTAQRSQVYYLARHSTLLSLCDLTFPDGFGVTYFFQYVPNQGGNVLDAVKGIAGQWNATVEFAPDGRIQIVRDTRFLSDKSGVPIIANFDNRDFTAIETLAVDPVNKTGRLDAYGASYNAGNLLTTRSRAPGSAQSYAAGQSTLDNQILAATTDQNAAQSELNYRAGQQMAIDNLTYTQDWKAVTGGYHFLIPSRGQRITHLLATDTNDRGLSFGTSDYWQVVSITISHDNATGAREILTHEELEPPVGDSGDTVPQIAPGSEINPITLQPLDPFPPLPDPIGDYLPPNPTPNPYPPLLPPKTGDTVIYTDGSIADTSRSVLARRTPVWTGATPTDLGAYVIKDICFDRTTTNPPIGAYLLASDGTNSAIWHTPSVFAKPSVWTKGADISGQYSIIGEVGISGNILIYGSGTNTWQHDIDFTASDGGFTNVDLDVFQPGVIHTPNFAGVYAAGVGWQQSISDNSVGGPATRFSSINIEKTLSTALTKIEAKFNRTTGNDLGDVNFSIYARLAGVLQLSQVSFPGPTGTGVTLTWTGAAPIDEIQIAQNDGECQPAPCTPGGSTTLLNLHLEGTGVNPFGGGGGGGGNSVVASSTDYGATLSSPVTVGVTPGAIGAFDVVRIGLTNIAASDGQVKISTGGAYSNAPGGTLSSGEPVSLVISYRRLPNGATQYSASDPDYVLGSSAIISSSCLWDVDGVIGTKTNINPVAGAICIGPHLLTIWQSSTTRKLAVAVDVSGTKKVYVWNGSSWAFSKTVTNPIYLRCRRNDPDGKQLYLLDDSTLYVSLDWGVTWLTDTLPSSNTAVSMDSYN